MHEISTNVVTIIKDRDRTRDGTLLNRGRRKGDYAKSTNFRRLISLALFRGKSILRILVVHLPRRLSLTNGVLRPGSSLSITHQRGFFNHQKSRRLMVRQEFDSLGHVITTINSP